MLTLPDLFLRPFPSLSLKLLAGVDGCDLDDMSPPIVEDDGESKAERVGVDGLGGVVGLVENMGVAGTKASWGADLARLKLKPPESVWTPTPTLCFLLFVRVVLTFGI